ncbi:MAG: thioesterase family protein [Hyphomonas sp.]|uniref:thioesterase family protein n=1 Tax=Hyphomonas sp. TaxID=87 RepID=UPI0034A061A4
MNLFFRFLRVFLPAFFSKVKTAILDLHIVRSAVWLGDQDPMGHMTNSRYSSFTDLGTMNFMGRTGALKTYRKRGWIPIVQYESFNYSRMLRYPQKFELQTRLAGWDDCFICFEHKFISKGQVHATSRMVARLYGRKKAKVTADMAMEALGVKFESPPLDEHYQRIIAELQARE